MSILGVGDSGLSAPGATTNAHTTISVSGAAIAKATLAPLRAARHFYPDVGWAVTILAWLTLTWALIRPALSLFGLPLMACAGRSSRGQGWCPVTPGR